MGHQAEQTNEAQQCKEHKHNPQDKGIYVIFIKMVLFIRLGLLTSV